MNVFLLHMFFIVSTYQRPTQKQFVGSEKHQLKVSISIHLLPGGTHGFYSVSLRQTAVLITKSCGETHLNTILLLSQVL